MSMSNERASAGGKKGKILRKKTFPEIQLCQQFIMKHNIAFRVYRGNKTYGEFQTYIYV